MSSANVDGDRARKFVSNASAGLGGLALAKSFGTNGSLGNRTARQRRLERSFERGGGEEAKRLERGKAKAKAPAAVRMDEHITKMRGDLHL